jgi:uncharacterized membrane protein YdjX (TVP38/TMEM64 family)
MDGMHVETRRDAKRCWRHDVDVRVVSPFVPVDQQNPARRQLPDDAGCNGPAFPILIGPMRGITTRTEEGETPPPSHHGRRALLLAVWILTAGTALWAFLFHRTTVQEHLAETMSISTVVAASVYLLLSSLRGFTFIPAAPLLVLGLAFFPPLPLFLLTLAGIMISSAIIYWFSGALHLEEVFSERYARWMDRIHSLLHKRELPVITAWCLIPVTPADLMVYACGVLRISFLKTMLGVAIGCGINCAVVIFLGDQLLRFLQVKG